MRPMKISGFTFIRNAITYDYPIVEAIQSVLPICTEFIVAVGKSDDNTLQLIRDINSDKIKILETEWNESLRTGGKVLAMETDKALNAVSRDADWCFYVQGDEVMHEKYLDTVYQAMEKWKDDDKVDGLLFKYLHFYGSYNYVGNSSKWYPNEIRVIRRNASIYSYCDAQGFRKGDNKKLKVKPVDAYIYHYGWVRNPVSMQKKQETFGKLWHDDTWMEQNIPKVAVYDYETSVEALRKFNGTHPAVMKKRIEVANWPFNYDSLQDRASLKEKVKQFFRERLRLDFSYRNYKII